MKMIRRHTDLVAWKMSMDLVEEIYRLTKSFPREELYGLTAQIRRSAISIPSNIAEGHGRSGRREFAHHLSIALGSLVELETQILIAARLDYLLPDDVAKLQEKASEAGRVVVGLMNSLERHAAAS